MAVFTARSEILQRHVEHQAHVPDLRRGQIFQNRNKIHELVVVSIGEPGGDGNGVLRVEDVRCGRVVNDDCLAEGAADLAQVFDIVSLVVIARLAEETVVDGVGDVQLVEERVAIFGYGGCEDNDFVDFANALEECIDSWALDDIHVVILALDFDGDSEVGLVEDLMRLLVEVSGMIAKRNAP